MVFRTVAQFTDINQIANAVVQFSGDVGNAISVKSLGTVSDGSEEKTTIGYLYAPVNSGKSEKSGFFGSKKQKVKRETKPALFLEVYKQSGANTVAVVDGIVERIQKINETMKDRPGKPKLTLIYDGAKIVRMNLDEVRITILIGIVLAIIVVYLFLGNLRSTFITGIALPNSILGAFILMYIMGYTINVITLLALSLTVGLLVDDAIVVRENIFRKLEAGMKPAEAAEKGTTEVMLAVIATTLTIMAVFVPIGFLSGIVGQFFKQFGFTIVFAMAISLFDALTVAPVPFRLLRRQGPCLAERRHPELRAVPALDGSMVRQDHDLYTGPSASHHRDHHRHFCRQPRDSALHQEELHVLQRLRRIHRPDPDAVRHEPRRYHRGGDESGGADHGRRPGNGQDIHNRRHERRCSTQQPNFASLRPLPGQYWTSASAPRRRSKTSIRKMLKKEFAYARPKVNEYSMGMTSMSPFILNIVGNDLDVLDEYAQKLVKEIKKIPDLTDVDTSSEAGKPEFQVVFNPNEMQKFGVMPAIAGAELRYQIAGEVVGELHDKGLEYDVRLRLKPEQRDLRSAFSETKIPNQMYRLVPLSAISKGVEKSGPSQIIREDRSRVVQITANLTPDGAIGTATDRTMLLLTKKMPPPKGVTYNFIGQTEDLKELSTNMLLAVMLAVVFIYFILASLYESFITPVTILMALPPALSGAFLALFLFGQQLNMFSMIGMIMLMGLVTKNSILLVDFAMQGHRSGLTRKEAIYKAGMTRLRPILMTTFAMLAGTLPVATGYRRGVEIQDGHGYRHHGRPDPFDLPDPDRGAGHIRIHRHLPGMDRKQVQADNTTLLSEDNASRGLRKPKR